MPGFDLCTRRRVRLKKYWMTGRRRFLDAGSGNGWFAYLAYRSGAVVTAVNFSDDQVKKSRSFYNERLGIREDFLKYECCNLYELAKRHAEEQFTEIICYETMEHIRDDSGVCQQFHGLLAPGGVLHLCCPYARHPRWQAEVLDREERGGHVRAGYTVEAYRALLEPIGFTITHVEGVGGTWLTRAESLLSCMRAKFGDLLSLPLALLFFPIVWVDKPNLECPYSLYIRAIKQSQPAVAALKHNLK